MTHRTIGGYSQSVVVRVDRLRIIGAVTSAASIRRSGIITLVTSVAIARYGYVCTSERIKRVVIKRRWCPRGLCMARGTLRRELSCCVVRAGRSGIIAVVAAIAGIWCIRIVALVASRAIIGNGYVCTYEWVNGIVIEGRWRPGCLAMATGTIRGELSGGVVRTCRGGIIAVVTGVAGIGRVVVVAVVAGGTISCNCGVCTVQGIVIIVDRESGWFPTGRRGVTHRTVGGYCQGAVIWIC